MSQKSPPVAPKARISVARNPRASHDYHLLETWEAGIVLTGTEVKSLRNRKASIKEAYALVRNGEVWLEGMHITPYEQGNRWNPAPVRSRKLLMHRREIERLIGAVEQKGFTLVPLEIYFLGGRAKVALALGKGKQTHDRREDIKRRLADREMARALKQR
jgi:SsrA-binding protein